MREILLLSGPNLDLLGTRNPEIYGTATLADHVRAVTERAAAVGLDVRHLQSNFEGDLIEAVHALTHTSWALADALAIFEGPKIEIHLSNPAAREPFRHLSTVAGVVDGSLAGLGALGYLLAVDAVAALLDQS
jgi:3-dehydroquinate dehydratase-2